MPDQLLHLCHNDAPAQHDAFGQASFIAHISNVIKHCAPPKGIAINGYWGTGKTSALMQVYHALSGHFPQDGKPTKKTHITCVWFEAWRYQHDAMPVVALLNEIRAQMGAWEKFKNAAKQNRQCDVAGDAERI